MENIAIRVEDLGKKYKIGTAPNLMHYQTLRDSIADSVKAPLRKASELARKSRSPRLARTTPEELFGIIWALRHINFEVNKGQVFGVIGRNGSGKSTLLKILSRVTEPTEGYAEIHGRVGSLLEVGTGFHPELTGRENIFLNGAILGMKRAEIERKFDEIVAFAEVERFIDTPVKRYSSGMYLRLAFAVAAHLEPEILVVDEVLAVGDAEFQRKCLGKMSDVAQEGRTVLFVSHNMSAILRLTEQTIVLDRGKLIKLAPTQEAVDFYLSSGFAEVGERIWSPDEVAEAKPPFEPVSLRIKNSKGAVVDTVRSTEPLTIEMLYKLSEPIKGLRIGIYLLTSRGEHVFTSFDTDTPEQYEKYMLRGKGEYISRCIIPADFLNGGRYIIGVNASAYRVKRYFQDENALIFNVDISGAPGTQWAENRMGTIRPRLDWQIIKDNHRNPTQDALLSSTDDMRGSENA
jgi:lipopolysaccharide transport system ATP-binding protein